MVGTDTDVVVLDLDPATHENHLEQLRGLPAGLPTVVLGNDRHTADVAQAAGASYLDKADVADQLLDAVLVAADRGAMRTTSSRDHAGTGAIVLVALALFAGPWTWWFSRIAQDHGVTSWHLPQGLALWTMPPLLVAALAVTGGRRALSDLGRRSTRVRVPAWTWAAALLTPVLVAGLAATLTTALGRDVPVGEVLTGSRCRRNRASRALRDGADVVDLGPCGGHVRRAGRPWPRRARPAGRALAPWPRRLPGRS